MEMSISLLCNIILMTRKGNKGHAILADNLITVEVGVRKVHLPKHSYTSVSLGEKYTTFGLIYIYMTALSIVNLSNTRCAWTLPLWSPSLPEFARNRPMSPIIQLVFILHIVSPSARTMLSRVPHVGAFMILVPEGLNDRRFVRQDFDGVISPGLRSLISVIRRRSPVLSACGTQCLSPGLYSRLDDQDKTIHCLRLL